MKISKLFHWLYASLCFLPLLVAPIFAIYTRNESATYNESIQVEQNKIVDFNQLLKGNGTYSNNYYMDFTTSDTSNYNYQLGFNHLFNISIGHKYLFRITERSEQNCYGYFLFNIGGNYQSVYHDNGSSIFNANYSSDSSFISLVLNNTSDTSTRYFKGYLNLIDLTQMFGVGNEPTLQQFNTWYDANYYDYTTSRIELLHNYSTVTYDYTDIGSQFVYSLYITTEKYLNFDNVFNLYQLYDWIELNAFSGNAPLIFTIAWHYLDYWLILSIFWLCFDVLMYVPQLAHRWLDKASLE